MTVNKKKSINWEDVKHIVISLINEYYQSGNKFVIDKDLDETESKKDLIDIEKAGFGTTAARAVAEAVGKVMSGDNPDVKRENIDLDKYFMDPDDVRTGRRDPETGVITVEKMAGDYYVGDKMYYNYNTNTWYTYQEDTGIFLPVNPT